MVDRDLVIENAKKKFSGELLDIVLKQIGVYFEIERQEVFNKTYKIGDDVCLTENHLLHGIGNHSDILDVFAKRGIVSQDFFGDDSNPVSYTHLTLPTMAVV